MILSLLLLAGLQDPVQPAPAEPAMRRYRVDPEVSVIGFDGTSTLHDFTGRSRDARGEVRFDPDHLESTLGGEIRVGCKTLDTGNEKRDAKMRSVLEVDEHPTLRFTIDGVTGSLRDRNGVLETTGRFDIHGVERPRALSLRVTADGDDGIRVRGDSRFDISDHGIDPPGVFFVSMHDEVRAWLDVTLLPVGGPTTEAPSRTLAIRESRTDDVGDAAPPPLRTERIWIGPRGMLWERAPEAEWILVREEDAWLLDLRRATRQAPATAPGGPPNPTEEASPAEIVREGGDVVLRADGIDWVELEGLVGDAPFAAALAFLPDLPPAVRRRLREVRGIPRVLRARTSEGRGRLEIRPGAEEPGRVPGWAWEPEAWTTSPDEVRPRKAG